MLHRFLDFFFATSFFILVINLAACLLKTGCLARNWPLACAKFAAVFLMFQFGICFRLKCQPERKTRILRFRVSYCSPVGYSTTKRTGVQRGRSRRGRSEWAESEGENERGPSRRGRMKGSRIGGVASSLKQNQLIFDSLSFWHEINIIYFATVRPHGYNLHATGCQRLEK